MKKLYRELLFSMAVSVIFAVIWAIPLKGLTKFVLVQEWGISMDSYSTSGLVLFIILSGFISFVITKSIQYLKGQGCNICFSEFAFIFTISIALTTIFLFLGYPLLGFLVSGGGWIIYSSLFHLFIWAGRI